MRRVIVVLAAATIVLGACKAATTDCTADCASMSCKTSTGSLCTGCGFDCCSCDDKATCTDHCGDVDPAVCAGTCDPAKVGFDTCGNQDLECVADAG